MGPTTLMLCVTIDAREPECPTWRAWQPGGHLSEGDARPLGPPGADPPGPAGTYFDEPTKRPDTKWRWKAKNTTAVGSAAISVPAATRFQLET